MRRFVALAVVAAAFLGACTDRGYTAKPVVSEDDPREVRDIPDIAETEAREKQRCFMIEIYATGFETTSEDEGIACLVEPER